MPYERSRWKKKWHSYPLRITLFSFLWLIVISYLHMQLNFDHDDRKTIHMGYMPVITNLAAPLIDQASHSTNSDIIFKAIKFASFAEMAEALRNDEIQAGFIIAPLSIVLRQQGEDVKVVYIGNRHESTLVARKDLHIQKLQDLAGHTVAVPMRYSGHNLSILKMIKSAGLTGQVKVVEMNPPDMASALAAGSLDAYYVGEPFAAQTLKKELSNLVFYVEKEWPGFICNLLLVRQSFIEKDPAAVEALVHSAVRSGIWARQYRDEAAEVASKYWGQPVDLVRYALNTPADRIVFDRYTPKEQEMQQIADLMVEFGLLKSRDVDGLIDDRFAKSTDMDGMSKDIGSIIEQ